MSKQKKNIALIIQDINGKIIERKVWDNSPMGKYLAVSLFVSFIEIYEEDPTEKRLNYFIEKGTYNTGHRKITIVYFD